MTARIFFVSSLVILGCGGSSTISESEHGDSDPSVGAAGQPKLPAQSAPPHASERVQKAEAEMSKGNFEGAKVMLEAALQEDDADARAHFNMGIVQEELGELTAAELAYKLALKHRPEFAHASTNLGLLYYRQDKLAEAKAMLERSLDVSPDSVEAHFNLAMVLAALGDAQGAIRHAERASELAPSDAQVWLRLGLFRAGVGDTKGARDAAKRAQANAQTADFLLQAELGALLRQVGDNEGALTAFEHALKGDHLAPRVQAALLTERALALKGTGQAEQAMQSVEQALKMEPQYPLAHYVVANMLASDKKWKKAEVHYKRFLTLAPEDPNAEAARAKLAKVKALKKK